MSFLRCKPSSNLDSYIKQYWMIDNCLKSGEEHIQRIIPSGMMELTFYFGSKAVGLNGRRISSDYSTISGQYFDYYDLKINGRSVIFSITFLPNGISQFFDLPLYDLMNYTVPLKFILKEGVEKIEDQLYEATTFKDKVRLIEKFLLSCMNKKNNPYDTKRINESLQSIFFKKGIQTIEEIASNACLSRKQFDRIFQNRIGISPKKYLQIVRFQNALFEKQTHPDLSLTELSYRCGYFDQSHMVKEFQRLSGLSPGDFFDQCEPCSDLFSY